MRFKQLLISSLVAILLLWTTACQNDTPTALPVTNNQLKIEITADALYALPFTTLQEMGLVWEGDPTAALQLTTADQPVPYIIEDEQLLFYGRASDSIYTNNRPYILQSGTAGVQMVRQPAPPSTAVPLTQITQSQHLEQNLLYVSNAYTPEYPDTWYWHTIHVEQQFETTFTLPNTADGSGHIRLHLWGASHDPQIENDHDFDLYLNGQLVGTVRWEGQTHFLADLAIPAGTLRTGENTLLLDNQVAGATLIDIMNLDWVAVDYTAAPTATNDQISVQDTAGTVSLTGFSAPPLMFNIADPNQPTLLTDWEPAGNGALVSATAEMHLLAIGPQGAQQPAQLTGLRPTTLHEATNQADFLIITTDALIPALEPLAAARTAEGLTTRIVPVAEIYDAFGAGAATPAAITNFLRTTTTTWASPAPRYLLLVGEATYDYRNYLGQEAREYVPSLMIPVTHSGETVSDARLADTDGDFHPNMAVGRWPVGTPTAVADLVRRTLAYQQTPTAAQALFAADGTSAEFTDLADYLVDTSLINTSGTAVTKLYGASLEEVTADWNQGAWLVTYVGHGSLNLWGKESLFNSDAIANLSASGSAPPLVLQFTCLTGFFAHPTEISISERLLTAEDGPVLLVGATSLTLSAYQRPFALSLLNLLQQPDMVRMGDVVQAAKLELNVADLGLREISDTFGLLGDPTAPIQRPINN